MPQADMRGMTRLTVNIKGHFVREISSMLCTMLQRPGFSRFPRRLTLA
jgi:hypothetical protein